MTQRPTGQDRGAPKPRLGRPRDWLLGAALLAGLFITVQLTVGWSELLAPWWSLSPLVLIAAFGLTAASYALRAVRVYDYFGPLVQGRFPAVLRLSVLHNMANNLLPMRSGEMVFPWLMRRWFGHGFLAAGASLLWIRLLDLHVLGLAGLLVLWLRNPASAWVWLLAPAALLWLGLLPLTAWGVQRAARVPAARTNAAPQSAARASGAWTASTGRSPTVVTRLWGIARFVAEAGPARPAGVGRLYLWTLLSWAAKLAAFVVVLRHFVSAELWQVLAGVMGAELSSVLPFHGIGGAGSYELATVVAMVPFGVGASEALAGAVNLHLFLLGCTLLLGLLALLIPGWPRRMAPRDAPDRP